MPLTTGERHSRSAHFMQRKREEFASRRGCSRGEVIHRVNAKLATLLLLLRWSEGDRVIGPWEGATKDWDVIMITKSSSKIDDRLLQRVYGEFLEMPGLRLTCQQAQRLWGLDEPTCRELLDFLVDARFLCRPTRGAYSRLTG